MEGCKYFVTVRASQLWKVFRAEGFTFSLSVFETEREVGERMTIYCSLPQLRTGTTLNQYQSMKLCNCCQFYKLNNAFQTAVIYENNALCCTLCYIMPQLHALLLQNNVACCVLFLA